MTPEIEVKLGDLFADIITFLQNIYNGLNAITVGISTPDFIRNPLNLIFSSLAIPITIPSQLSIFNMITFIGIPIIFMIQMWKFFKELVA